MKTAYTIKSSEDGIIGVYSNKKEVFRKLDNINPNMKIETHKDDGSQFGKWLKKDLTYNRLSSQLREYKFATAVDKFAQYKIDHFYVNS